MKFALSHHKMSPKSLLTLGIIGWKLAFFCQSVHFSKNRIDSIISKDTVSTVFDTVKSACHMKSKAIFIMHTFFFWNIFSPREFKLVSIVLRIRAGNNWWKYNITLDFLQVMKSLLNLCGFDFELLFIWNWKPFTASIELPFFRNLSLKRRLLLSSNHLRFYIVFSDFENPNWYKGSRYRATSDDDFFSLRQKSESFSSKDKFFYFETC